MNFLPAPVSPAQILFWFPQPRQRPPWVLLRFSNSLKPSLPHCRKTWTNWQTFPPKSSRQPHTIRAVPSPPRVCAQDLQGRRDPRCCQCYDAAQVLRCAMLPLSPSTSPSNFEVSAWQSSFGHPFTVKHLKSSKDTRSEKMWKVKTRSTRSDLLFRGVIHAVWNGSVSDGLRDFDANLSASTRRQHHLLATRTAYRFRPVHNSHKVKVKVVWGYLAPEKAKSIWAIMDHKISWDIIKHHKISSVIIIPAKCLFDCFPVRHPVKVCKSALLFQGLSPCHRKNKSCDKTSFQFHQFPSCPVTQEVQRQVLLTLQTLPPTHPLGWVDNWQTLRKKSPFSEMLSQNRFIRLGCLEFCFLALSKSKTCNCNTKLQERQRIMKRDASWDRESGRTAQLKRTARSDPCKRNTKFHAAACYFVTLNSKCTADLSKTAWRWRNVREWDGIPRLSRTCSTCFPRISGQSIGLTSIQVKELRMNNSPGCTMPFGYVSLSLCSLITRLMIFSSSRYFTKDMSCEPITS